MHMALPIWVEWDINPFRTNNKVPLFGAGFFFGHMAAVIGLPTPKDGCNPPSPDPADFTHTACNSQFIVTFINLIPLKPGL